MVSIPEPPENQHRPADLHGPAGTSAMGKPAVLEVMLEVKRRRSAAFAGLGVVFYVPPLNLPIASLGSPRNAKPALPIVGARNAAAALADVCDKSSPWHDGFHLIDVQSVALTHIAQFIAPALDPVLEIAADARPKGARQMTALLTSRLKCVHAVALLSTTGVISLYFNGALSVRLPPNYE
jgi:hypothetical protein